MDSNRYLRGLLFCTLSIYGAAALCDGRACPVTALPHPQKDEG